MAGKQHLKGRAVAGGDALDQFGVLFVARSRQSSSINVNALVVAAAQKVQKKHALEITGIRTSAGNRAQNAGNVSFTGCLELSFAHFLKFSLNLFLTHHD
ncbi:MAG: hypothetical protein HKN11_12530 [Rhizobiales bacterium]|nr:hypothetical protein [Hyphomicrobiales bacterium]